VEALLLGAAAADVVSVLLLGAVELAGGCEAMLVLEVWSVLDVVLVAGVWLLTAGLVLAGACADSVEDAALAAFSPAALGVVPLFASEAGAALVAAAPLSEEDAMPGFEEPPEVSHLSETMLTLCMAILSLLMPVLLPVDGELELACALVTSPVIDTVWPTCCFNCAVSPVTLYCLPFALMM